MGFDIFLHRWKGGQSAALGAELVARVFGASVNWEADDGWRLDYGGDLNSCFAYIGERNDAPNTLSGLMISRPVADDRLWQSIYNLLLEHDFTLYFPGNCPPLVAKESVIDDLPGGMIESLGRPIIVKSPSEIVERILSS